MPYPPGMNRRWLERAGICRPATDAPRREPFEDRQEAPADE